MATEKPKSKRWRHKKADKMGLASLMEGASSPNRKRKDSGYFDDDLDHLSSHWADVIADWSAKAHSIISQEVERMREVTEAHLTSLHACQSLGERAAVVRRWQEDMAGIMGTTQDLVQCVVNDVTETNSSSNGSSSSSSMTSYDLGRILEEELMVNKEACVQSEWSRDLDGPSEWNAVSVPPEEEYDVNVEDIFSDWLAMVNGPKERQQEINQLFWSISMEEPKQSQRCISEVLDNLSFYDHPDIFCDRCELLEATKRQARRSGRRPSRCYWNLFNEWKHNLEEKRQKKRKQKKKRKVRRYRKNKKAIRPSPIVEIIVKEEKPLPVAVPAPAVPDASPEAEDFFFDAIGIFQEEPTLMHHRRRSRDEFEDDDEEDSCCSDRSAKRMRPDEKVQQGPWEQVQHESRKAFDCIEQKIREAFQQPEMGQDEDDDDDDDDVPVDFSFWPKSVALALSDSRTEFSELRDEVRYLRKHRRMSDDLACFHEWNWNLQEKATMTTTLSEKEEEMEQEDVMNVWRHIFKEEEETVAAIKGKKAVARKPEQLQMVVFSRPMQLYSQKSEEHRFWKLSNMNQAAKTQRRVMAKCFPQQPAQRRGGLM